MRCAIWSTIALLISCGPKVAPRLPFDEDEPRARSEHAAPAPAVEVAEERPTDGEVPARDGVIDRPDLVAVLEQGPGHLLSRFEITAEAIRGNFVGWRLVRFLPAGIGFAGLDVRPGDVLLTVNRRRLITPDDLLALWSELYAANEIVAELSRGSEPITIRFQIMPSAVGGAAAATAP